MSEHLLENYIVKELELPAGESINLDVTVEAVREHGIIAYNLGDKVSPLNAVVESVLNEVELESPVRDKYPNQGKVASERLGEIWRLIAGKDSKFEAIHDVLNVYEPDSPFVKHSDFDITPVSTCAPEEVLTFLYIASGSKDIQFYLNGEHGTPTAITQQPGMLYVFQGGGYIFPDGTSTEGLFHEVLSQGVTNSVTLNWELFPLSHELDV